MQISSASHTKALNFLKTGQLEGKKRDTDSINSSYSDQQVCRQMDDFVALDMGRVRGDQDDRFGHIKYTPDYSDSPVKVRVFGDTQDGGFVETKEVDGGVQSTYVDFTRDAMRSVTVFEKDEQAVFSAQHHDRNLPENGYLLTS